MEYITQKFENTPAGLKQKDEYTRQLAAQGYRITSEQLEQGHTKGSEQCCWALICLPGIFLAARTPGFIVVTYGREAAIAPVPLYCTSCGVAVPSNASTCGRCGVDLLGKSTPDQKAALFLVEQERIATAKTIEAQKSIQKLDRLLVDSLAVNYRFDWKSRIKAYPVARPKSRDVEPLPATPLWSDFEPKLSLFEKMVPRLRKKKHEGAQRAFLNAETIWKKTRAGYDGEKAAAAAEYLKACTEWDERQNSYEAAQSSEADTKQQLYLSKDVATIIEYCEVVCKGSIDIESLAKTHSLSYLPESRALIVQCDLPAIGSVPRVQQVRYAERRKTFDIVNFPDTWLRDFYDQLIYRITMRTMYILFQSDAADALDSIVFNGNVRALDRATGHEVNPCILSVQASKAVFRELNLSQVDPRACFNRLKGISSANIADLEPVVPIRQA